MGKLLYGSPGVEIGFEDRALAHLHVVIGSKLRRGEKFFFSWVDNVSVGSGRSSIWLEPSIPLYFKFNGSRPIQLNREWLQALNASANSVNGLLFSAEPNSPIVTPLPHGHI